MSDGAPTTYAELAEVIESLPTLLRHARRKRGLSVRAAAAQLDMTYSTLARIESGAAFNSRTLCQMLRWLGAA